MALQFITVLTIKSTQFDVQKLSQHLKNEGCEQLHAREFLRDSWLSIDRIPDTLSESTNFDGHSSLVQLCDRVDVFLICVTIQARKAMLPEDILRKRLNAADVFGISHLQIVLLHPVHEDVPKLSVAFPFLIPDKDIISTDTLFVFLGRLELQSL